MKIKKGKLGLDNKLKEIINKCYDIDTTIKDKRAIYGLFFLLFLWIPYSFIYDLVGKIYHQITFKIEKN